MRTSNRLLETAFAILFIIGVNEINAQTFEWAKSNGGSSADFGRSSKVDVLGNIYTTGSFQGTVDFDPGVGTFNLTSAGSWDVFVQKLDSSGNFLWAKAFGGNSQDYAYAIEVDALGNAYTTGYFVGTVDFDPGTGTTNLTSAGIEDVFVHKLDASGNFLWARRFGVGATETGYSIVVDSIGNVYTTGFFQGTVDFDPGTGISNLTSVGGMDVFVQKLNASGNFVWAKSFGGSFNDIANSIKVDNSGNVYTTGWFLGTVDFNPGTGTANLISSGQSDVFIQKLDASGNFLWARRFGDLSFDQGYSITVDKSGNVYTTGYFQGTVDFDPGAGTVNLTSAGGPDIFVQKLNASGNFVWARSFGGSISAGLSDLGYSITLDDLGNIYTTGWFQGTADFDPGTGTANYTSAGQTDVFIQKLDPSGNFIWARSFGDFAFDRGYSITVDLSGNIYTTGSFEWSVDFDPGIGVSFLTSAGNSDIFVQKLSICLPNTGSVMQTSCDSYTWPANSITYTSSGTYTTTLTNAAGCDSVVTLNLVIDSSSTGSQTATACDTYTWLANSTTYTSSGTYTTTLTNATGCDSVVTLNLVINSSSTGSQTETACDSYTWSANSQNYTTSGAYTTTLTNTAGCDSVVTLNLTINSVSDTTTTTAGFTITANNTGVAYQWLDCNNNYTQISGETGQSFTATANGSFAVELTESGCVDTSACVSITSVGIMENGFENRAIIFPNPSSGFFQLMDLKHTPNQMHLFDLQGRLVRQYDPSAVQWDLPVESGIYLLRLELIDGVWVQEKVVRE